MRYLTKREVVQMHFIIMKKYGEGEQAGIKDENLLDSAVHRPMASAFNEDAYPTLFEKAAALFESLVRNHCFHNGNKRTAFLALHSFLRLNGYKLISDVDENEIFTVSVAEGIVTTLDIEEWIMKYTEASPKK